MGIHVRRTGCAKRGTAGRVLDVAIVGGGYTGLSTALHTAEKGLSAHVFEANHIGFGGSGRNVWLVNASAWLPPEKIQNILGPVYGDRFIRQFSDGPQYVFDLIERYQIRCEPTKTGTLHVAHSTKGLKDLQARFDSGSGLANPSICSAPKKRRIWWALSGSLVRCSITEPEQ